MSRAVPTGRKPRIILISPTAGSLEQFDQAGFLSRQVALVQEYSKYFDVEYYTCDVRDYSGLLNVKHRPLPLKIGRYGFRHLFFWMYLVTRAPFMRAPIRTFGVELPVLPIVRALSRQKVMAGFPWDYATTTRANYTGIKRLLAGYLQNWGFKGADVVICTTERLRDIARNRYNKRTIIVPNFVDFRTFERGPQKEDTIIYVGRLHWSKGIDFLLSAFKQVAKTFPGYRLLVCGTGELDTSLKEMVAGEGIPNVEFLGAIKQDVLAGYMARSKAYVLPSITSEGHPKALIEAMASGTACVATRVPGNIDILTDNVTGLLVEPRDAEALTQALLRLLSDETFRSRIESEAYTFAKRFGLTSVLQCEASLINGFIAGSLEAS